MADGEIAAVFKGLAEDADQAAGNIAHSVAGVSERAADIEESNLASTLENETQTAKAFDNIREPAVPEPAPSIESRLGGDEPPPEPPSTAEPPAEPPAQPPGEPPGEPPGGGSGDGRPTTPAGDQPPSSAIHNEDGIPGASGNTQKLGQLDEAQVTRDENGLITHVNGTPVKDYANDLGAERRGVYQAAKADGTLSGKAQGNCIAVGIDQRTGAVYEGINGRARDVIPSGDLHPTVQQNLDTLRANGPYSWGDGAPSHEFPHPDNPLGHAEVKTTNQAMWDRTNQGLPDDPNALGEIVQSPQFQFIAGGRPAPFCANCNGTLSGVQSATGRFTSFPPTDGNLIP